MCGRTACTLAPDDICRACSYRNKQGKTVRPTWKDAPPSTSTHSKKTGDLSTTCTADEAPPTKPQYYPSYNISPQKNTPVLVSAKHFPGEVESQAERVLTPMQWGLVPAWYSKESDPLKFSSQYKTNNCRSEGMLEKKSFKGPLNRGQRCVVLADGFYEWKREKNSKQPYFIYFAQSNDNWFKSPSDSEKGETTAAATAAAAAAADGKEWTGRRLLTMAGIFDCWKSQDGELLYTYSIITVDSKPSLDWLHDRMPAILDGEEAVSQWLDFSHIQLAKAVQLVKPVETLRWHPVSSIVNNSRNHSPECFQPVELGKPNESAGSKLMSSWLSKGTPPKKRQGDSSDKTSESKDTKVLEVSDKKKLKM